MIESSAALGGINTQLVEVNTVFIGISEQLIVLSRPLGDISRQLIEKGWAKLLFAQFIVVMADESQSTHVGGCSTDGMMRLMKSLEKQYNVNLFDRMTLTFLVKGKAEMLPYEQVQYALDKGFINEDTLMFNNIATTKKEILESWLVPLKYSWLAGRVQLPMVNN